MSTLNILNKKGLLSDEDRKAPLQHNCEHFKFETVLDLSEPIKVTPYGSSGGKYPLNYYSADVASFICWWTNFVMHDLNGFSGFHHIKFELIGFEVESK